MLEYVQLYAENLILNVKPTVAAIYSDAQALNSRNTNHVNNHTKNIS